MRIALYQCPPLPLDISGNLARLEQQAVSAVAQSAQLLICPEMFLTGYNIGAQAVSELAQAHDGSAAMRIAAIAKANGIAILYGYPERDTDQQIYNAVQLIDEHGVSLCNYRKTHLFSELDRSMFSAGADYFPVVELNGWRLGMLICYDVEFPENTRRLALAGAELILVPTANMAPYDFVCEVTVRARASRTTVTWCTPTIAAAKARFVTAGSAAFAHRTAAARCWQIRTKACWWVRWTKHCWRRPGQ
ncbi:hypothetical protein PSA5_08210 [Pseudomonas syringae pv. actinidiae]|nr:hypothetical protein PSA5_08210 [Pseudomonas syringae pv. actinidiae]